MSAWWTTPCDCPGCTVANTPSVVFPKTRQVPFRRLHGVEAARFIGSRERGMAKISELAERLRSELGIKAQRGDEPR
jgi:hypothetical protein